MTSHHEQMDIDHEQEESSLPTVSIPSQEWTAMASRIGEAAGKSGEDMDMFKQGRKSRFPNGVR